MCGESLEIALARLTTHVLDTSSGRPAAGMTVRLFRLDGLREAGEADGVGQSARPIVDVVTNADGRCDQPLLDGAAFVPGCYRLVFAAGRYFAAQGLALPSPPFLDDISIDFGIADASSHYHVPLLVSPWSYATYRGS